MNFLSHTSSDLRAGKSTWRVMLTLDFITFAVVVAWSFI